MTATCTQASYRHCISRAGAPGSDRHGSICPTCQGRVGRRCWHGEAPCRLRAMGHTRSVHPASAAWYGASGKLASIARFFRRSGIARCPPAARLYDILPDVRVARRFVEMRTRWGCQGPSCGRSPSAGGRGNGPWRSNPTRSRRRCASGRPSTRRPSTGAPSIDRYRAASRRRSRLRNWAQSGNGGRAAAVILFHKAGSRVTFRASDLGGPIR